MRIGESLFVGGLVTLLATSALAQAQTGVVRVSVKVPGTLTPVPDVQILLEGVQNPPPGLLDLPDNEQDLLAYLEELAAARGIVTGTNSTSMRCPGPGVSSAKIAAPQAVTDAAGNATIQNLNPGKYVLRAAREGFLGVPERTSITALAPSTITSSVVVESGILSTPVSLFLNPAATVSGRVVDANNTPVVNACVVLGLVRTDNAGKTFVSGPRAFTDNMGEYQLQSVSPGEYAVRVHSQTRFGITYLLGEDLDKATLLSIQPGTNAVGIDFKLP
jgi:hypothetical protein